MSGLQEAKSDGTARHCQICSKIKIYWTNKFSVSMLFWWNVEILCLEKQLKENELKLRQHASFITSHFLAFSSCAGIHSVRTHPLHFTTHLIGLWKVHFSLWNSIIYLIPWKKWESSYKNGSMESMVAWLRW
jgi:hypothetical protein